MEYTTNPDAEPEMPCTDETAHPVRYVLQGRSNPYGPFGVHKDNVPITGKDHLKRYLQQVEDYNRKAGYQKYRLVTR